jgi:hypothetical protein
MKYVHGSPATGSVGDLSAVTHVPDGIVGDAVNADPDGIFTPGQQAAPGAPGGGAGLREGLFIVLLPEPASKCEPDRVLEGREVRGELTLG